MNRLIEKIAKTDSKVKRIIDERWDDFTAMHRTGEDKWFSELCFCILTANTSAEMGVRVQKALGYEGFAKIPDKKLARALRDAGARFYNTRAGYIIAARRYDGKLKETITGLGNQFKAREWLFRNVKGIGYKEASHFLRNVGYGNVAILDKHILNILRRYDLIGDFKRVGKRRYIAIEHVLRHIAETAHMPLGKLDLYLWYFKTGKVLK